MPSLEERVEFLINKVDNGRCADCFDKQPANVAILVGGLEKPIGAFICFRCARIHQKFGNDLGYVLNARNEDDWSEEEVQALERGGNKIVNAIFESKIAYDHPRPDVNSPNDVRETFCTEKYVNRQFYSQSKAAKFLKSSGASKQSSGRFALKAAAKDTGSSRGGMNAELSLKDLNKSNSTRGGAFSDSSGEFSFDESFGEDTPDMNQLSLEQQEPARPRQRVRARRRGSVGADSAPRRAMSLQVESGVPPNANIRRSRPGRRASLGRTSSMGGAPVIPEAGGGETPRMRRAGRRGSIGTSNDGSSNNLKNSGSGSDLRHSGHGSERRRGKKGGGLGNMLNLSNHGDNLLDGNKSVVSREQSGKGKEMLGGSSHHGGGRRRPQRRGSIGVEDANAKLNEKREMVW